MTTQNESPEVIPLEEFDALRRHLWLIEASAAHLAGEAERLSVAVNDLPKRPEWNSRAESEIVAASSSIRGVLSVVQGAMTELEEIKVRYQAKKPFI